MNWKPLECCPCKKKFHTVSELNSHTKTHSLVKEGEKPFSCVQCDKTFGSIREWENHSVTHALQPPKKYRYCSHCGLRLLENVWEEHELTCSRSPKSIEVKAKSGTIKKQYDCNKCDQKFASLGKLKEHESNHTRKQDRPLKPSQKNDEMDTRQSKDFKCNKCDQRFENFKHFNECSNTETVQNSAIHLMEC